VSLEDGSLDSLGNGLPKASGETTGASVAVDFDLKAGESKTVRFVLTWYYPILHGINSHAYLHAYGPRFKDAVAVAEMMAVHHQGLLDRVIAWQEVIYAEDSLPGWLRDCLVNTLYLLAEDAFWETNSIPGEPWVQESGMFTMVESTRTCPGQSCIPSDFYGNFPVVYFFPELAMSTLRGFANLQRPNGEIPIYWGQNYDRQNPVYQLLHVTSPCNYVDIVDRLWLRTGDDAIVHELFPSVKQPLNPMAPRISMAARRPKAHSFLKI